MIYSFQSISEKQFIKCIEYFAIGYLNLFSKITESEINQRQKNAFQIYRHLEE